ncbi:MAG TPA: SCP2 sterol-binding domain-containing protein [Xanthobacteraceae bacterium]|nr:SCP2 sterol-binding domain-containing protein [Xanthobacteraceae bacterium]
MSRRETAYDLRRMRLARFLNIDQVRVGASVYCAGMSLRSRAAPRPPLPSFLQDIPRLLLRPVPLSLLQPILNRIADHVGRANPALFARLGPHAGKRFLIDPTDLPFVLVLRPARERPSLQAYRRFEHPPHEAAIAGTFFTLFDMIDGSLDGDALFFSRDLRVSGDTEAVVALRNALDDIEGGVLDVAVRGFGPLSGAAAFALSILRTARRTRDDE